MKINYIIPLPIKFTCLGGGGDAPPPPPPPPPPPQLAKTPDAMQVRADTMKGNIAQGGGTPSTTLLTGGKGDPTNVDTKLGKKTLLGA